MSMFSRISENDLVRIRETVKRAENQISGEIMPVLVRQSHHYPAVKWKSGSLLALVAFVAIVVIDRWFPQIAVYDPLYYFLIVSCSGILGAMLPLWFPSLKRFLVTEAEQKHAARQKAETVFLEEEVFNTAHRTGIMIFVSFLEHEVIVMADSGISSKVNQKEWDSITNNLIDHIKAERLIDGIEEAVTQCGQLLLEKGFSKKADDKNELSDHLRIDP
ncbi:Hypothetical protein C900_02735 [Fulvivirga imtechensis AK7]|uniref:TPM domain-containing protein n=1 Tax=Fulvivirga imtechensis AK7 TaxID=1237149 RepID=L8JUZ1_9BACT|nr:hypothetical protein [Fulvivirga imtechensis]ELR71394.1 Hypothetical protein C900_02735 [Fulvivirga imtechensis AK7]